MFDVNEDTWLKVFKMFNKSKEEVEKDVNIILEWFKTQPHLPEIMSNFLMLFIFLSLSFYFFLDKAKIANFLLLNKFSIEKTKQKIDNYYTIRSKIPDVYDDCNPKLPHMQRFPELW